jgi:glycosyltransferase involved in cell wall biosynthesis
MGASRPGGGVPATRPRFSVVTPVYETPEALLLAAIDSVERQTWGDWELVLADDGSIAPHVHRILDEAAARDPRIRVIRRPANGGIVAASNDALDAARGEFVALFDHDDELHPDALARVAAAIDDRDADDVDYVYTDEDKIDLDGAHSQAFRKPAWSPDRLRCQPYTCHLSVFRRSLVSEVGGFRPGYDGSQDFDLTLRITEKARTVVHVPEILYHWRLLDGSTAADANAKPYAWVSGVKAIQDHCDRTGFEATARLVDVGLYGLEPALREHPLVSIVIPTAAQIRELYGQPILLAEQCVRGIVERSTYDNYEIVVVVDERVPQSLRARIEEAGGDHLHTVEYHKPFNFADKCNVGAVLSEGEHLLFLNDDTDVITPHWIESLLMYSRSPGVGAVGARLLFGDGRLQHVGVGMMAKVTNAHHLYSGYGGDYPGYFNACRTPCNYSAVTAACLMTPRAVFEEAGGFTTDLPVNFNDVDYCLKLVERGRRVVYDPGCELHHHESSTRPAKVDAFELETLRGRWPAFGQDPFLHPDVRGINHVFFR